MFEYRSEEDYAMYRALHNTLALKMQEEQRRQGLTRRIYRSLIALQTGGEPSLKGLSLE